MGVTPDVDYCNNKFGYNLFSLFTYKHGNSKVETVAETISLFHKITYDREGKYSNMQQARCPHSYEFTVTSNIGTTSLDYLLLVSLNR